MGAVLTTEPVQRMMFDQGYIPGQGQGKDLQEDSQAVADKKLTVRYGKDKAGLGNLF